MARIQKKKTVFRARKKDDAAADGVNHATGGEIAETGSGVQALSDAGNEPKRKKTSALRESSVAEPSAVMKLIDRYFGNWIQYFREVKVELTKVTWPSKKQTIGSTIVVIVFVFIISLFLGVVDVGLSSLVQLIL